MDTNRQRNFLTWEQYREGMKKSSNKGCYPLVVDVSDSKGYYKGTDDNPATISNNVQVVLVTKVPLAKAMDIRVVAITKGSYQYYTDPTAGVPTITKF